MQCDPLSSDAERELLRALVQTAAVSLRRQAARRLADYRWQQREHELLFAAWQRAGGAVRRRPPTAAELAAAAVQLGFPELVLEDLFAPLADPAGQLRRRLERLAPRRWTLRRWLALVDVIGLPIFLLGFIWRWQFTQPRAWLVFPLWLGLSFLVQRDTPRTLGWRADNLGAATGPAAAFLGLAAAALVAVGELRGASLAAAWQSFSLRHLWNYFAFCVLQQVALNSFLTNRLLQLLPPSRAAVVAGAIFAAAHWPNPVLVPLTFVAGTAMAWLFARQRNVLPLAAAQAVAGLLVGWSFPVGWHHNLRVGPGYDQWGH